MSTGPDSEEYPPILEVVGEELGSAWRIMRCASYVLWWRVKHYLWADPKLHQAVQIAAASSAFVLFLDVLIVLLQRELPSLLAVFRGEVPAWFGGAALIVLAIAALLLLLHRVEEAKRGKRKISFPGRVATLVDALTAVAEADVNAKTVALDDFVTKVLSQIRLDFGEERKIEVNVNLMLKKEDGKLRIIYLYPPGTKYDPELCFDPGEGVAGFVYKASKIIYVPSIKYMHGIVIGIPDDGDSSRIRYGLKRRLYMAVSPNYEIFRSILCLPAVSHKKTHAVLNIDCQRTDAFNYEDIYVAKAYSRILADGISLVLK